MAVCCYIFFLNSGCGHVHSLEVTFDLGLVNTVKLGGKVVVGTWRCLKAAVSWVMCRVRHLDVHLALLIFSWTSSCSGELLRARLTANTAHKSTRPVRQADIIPRCVAGGGGIRKINAPTHTRKMNRWSFPSSCQRPALATVFSSEWNLLLLLPLSARAHGVKQLYPPRGHSHHR